MKIPKLMLQDYLVGALVIIILASGFASQGFVQIIFYLLLAGALLYVVFKAGKALLKTFGEDGFEGLLKKILKELAKWLFLLAQILTLGSLLWIWLKLMIGALEWLKNGFWTYQHDSLCSVFELNCFPNTGFVKINEFVSWLFAFDVEVWLILLPWAFAISFWLLLVPAEERA